MKRILKDFFILGSTSRTKYRYTGPLCYLIYGFGKNQKTQLI
ncbi:hypothetical protein pb186bvf_011547 [Paramecium bursaria]